MWPLMKMSLFRNKSSRHYSGINCYQKIKLSVCVQRLYHDRCQLRNNFMIRLIPATKNCNQSRLYGENYRNSKRSFIRQIEQLVHILILIHRSRFDETISYFVLHLDCLKLNTIPTFFLHQKQKPQYFIGTLSQLI